MQIFTELNKNPNLSLALGYFDGVHLGHQAVIKSAVDFTKKNGGKSAVITFSDHPCCYFWNVCPKYILTRKARERKIEDLGVDFLYELDFESLANLTAQDYLKDVLINNFMPISISTGWNHNFGCKKSGDVKFLHENSKKYGYEYFEIQPQKINNEVINSTTIRKLLSDGNIEKANSMLGYEFTITGEVVKGKQIGRTIGFRTANLVYPPELIGLPYGVYSVTISIKSEYENQFETKKGIANFGVRPTVNGSHALLEVHILDFDKDIYGKNISVSFQKMLRPERKFNSLSELKLQIENDIKSI
jgi:riboflavin kinase/FMN adenylyltransferase